MPRVGKHFRSAAEKATSFGRGAATERPDRAKLLFVYQSPKGQSRSGLRRAGWASAALLRGAPYKSRRILLPALQFDRTRSICRDGPGVVAKSGILSQQPGLCLPQAEVAHARATEPWRRRDYASSNGRAGRTFGLERRRGLGSYFSQTRLAWRSASALVKGQKQPCQPKIALSKGLHSQAPSIPEVFLRAAKLCGRMQETP